MVYTVARLGLFVGAFAVVAGLSMLVTDTMPVLWSLLIAAVVSSVASVYLLKPQRERFAAVIERRANAASRKFEEARAKEDTD